VRNPRQLISTVRMNAVISRKAGNWQLPKLSKRLAQEAEPRIASWDFARLLRPGSPPYFCPAGVVLGYRN